MKKTLIAPLLFLFAVALNAATVPLYLTGTAGASYAISASAIVTTTNTTTLYTNLVVTVTNTPDGVDGDTLYVAWRDTAKTYLITNGPPAGDQISRGSNSVGQAYNILAKLQNDFPLAAITSTDTNAFQITAGPADNLVVTNSPNYFSLTGTASYNLTTSAGTVTLAANPATLTTNTVVYITAITTNASGAVTGITYGTNSIVISR